MADNLLPAMKYPFALRYLAARPGADLDDVNLAWSEEGHDDSISRSTFDKARAQLRAATNTHAVSATAEGPDAGPSDEPAPSHRSRLLRALEEDLDRLLFAAMNLGGLAETEGLLRDARRSLILASLDSEAGE